MKLNVGCGKNILLEWVNLDSFPGENVDIVFDLESCGGKQIPLEDNSVEEFLLSHILEHLRNPLFVMQELYRVAQPNAKMTIRTPYGSSDDAWEDPTHVRPYFLGSFGYFSQPFYWRADYGYKGDWQVQTIDLLLPKDRFEGQDKGIIISAIQNSRNVVSEMVTTLTCIKPARSPLKELQVAPDVRINLV